MVGPKDEPYTQMQELCKVAGIADHLCRDR